MNVFHVISLLLCASCCFYNARACPSSCKCKYTRVSCENLNLRTENLTRLVAELSNKTEVLYLGHNLIDEFPTHLFKKFKGLLQLHLPSNYLTRIPNNTQLYLPNLREINLERNRITKISSKDFTGYSPVRTLYLQENRLNSLPERTFEKLTELRYLYLEGNNISKIGKDSFTGLTNLLHLNLGDNYVEEIEPGSFQNFRGIQQIFLHNNKIRKIPNFFIAALNQIEYVDLVGNLIETISEFAFANMTNIRMTDIVLYNNRLTFIPSSSFKHSKRLKVDVGENFLQCDCQLLASYFQLTNSDRDIKLVTASCATPNHLQDRLVSNINATELQCDPCKIRNCKNGAKCQKKESEYYCHCTDAYEGTFCDRVKPVTPTVQQNACRNHACQNNGTCSSVTSTYYVCICPNRYSGKYCSKIKSKNEDTSTLPTHIWIAIAAVVVLVFIAIIIVCLCIRKEKRKKDRCTSDASKFLYKTDEDDEIRKIT